MIRYILSNWLGIDPQLLGKTSANEQKLFQLVGLFVAFALLTVFVADAYFGFLFNGGIAGFIGGMLFLGFIHYSVYRLCLLTLTTRPFIEAEPEIAAATQKPSIQKRLSVLKPSLPGMLRWVFTAFIAIAVAFPAATLMHHGRAEQILEAKRAQIISEMPETATQAINAVKEGSFPFLVFEELVHKPSFNLALAVLIALVFMPLLLLSRLRNGKTFTYTKWLRDAQKEDVRMEYFISVKDAQRFLDTHFTTSLHLESNSIYADAPFNSKLKKESTRVYGTQADFVSYLNSF
jgi:hypothetical protein